jgi:thioredoxin reductase (NADPH)
MGRAWVRVRMPRGYGVGGNALRRGERRAVRSLRPGTAVDGRRPDLAFIGTLPRTEWLDGIVVTHDRGLVVTGPPLTPDRWAFERDPFLLETSLPGVFAVGDVRATSVKRVTSAVG